MKIKAELLPLEGKYYGSYIEITGEKGYAGSIKVWLPFTEYSEEGISPREIQNIDSEDDINEFLTDWDYSHSESKFTYEVCKTIVEALNNKEI